MARKTGREVGRKSSRGGKKWLFLILSLTFLVRLVYLLEIRSHPLFDNPVVDAEAFLGSARSILSGNLSGELTWQAPFYSYFLAFLLSVSSSLFFVRLCQVSLSVVTCWLLYRLTDRHMGRAAAVATTLLFAVYGPLVYFDGEILATSLHIFLSVAAIFVLSQALASDSWRQFAAGGVLLGLSAVTRGTILLFLPFILLWIALNGRGRGKPVPVIRSAVLVLAGTAVVVAAGSLRNYFLSGEFIMVSPGAGINLYIGNNENARDTVNIRPGAEWDILAWEPVQRGYRSPADQSEYFTRKALGFMARRPLEALSLFFQKALWFTGGEEIVRNVDLYRMRKYSIVLSGLLWRHVLNFPFGLLFPLALVGIWLRRKSWRADFLLLGYLGSVAMSNLLFFPAARYRIPMVPVMLMFSATAVLWLSDRIKRADVRALGAASISLVVLIIAVNLGAGQGNVGTGGEEDFHVGKMLYRQGDLDGARRRFERALEEDPEYAEAFFFLGMISERRGESDRAERAVSEALEILPEFTEAHVLLGRLALARGDTATALAEYARALEIKPNMPALRSAYSRLLEETEKKRNERRSGNQ